MLRRTFLTALLAAPTLALGIDVKTNEMQSIVRGNTGFSNDLYHQLRTKPGNVFLSPFSISTALAMTAAGARGPTADEMNRVLHLSGGAENHRGFAELHHRLQAKKDAGYELAVANALWGQEGYPFDRQYLDLIEKNYGGTLRQLNFTRPSAAADTINRWVEQQTKNRIKKLIDPDMLDDDTRLVLTNAIYFKGRWRDPFSPQATHDAPFHTSADTSVSVPLMYRSGSYRYYEDDAMQLVQLPYTGNRLAMVFILPRQLEGLGPQVESRLTVDNLQTWLKAAAFKEVNLFIPRFQYETSYELRPTLENMGMRLAFSREADFTGMTSAERLKISAAIHKAFIKVDEEGSEAAAATGIIMRPTAAIPVQESYVFRADRPFLFLIRDLETESVLFIGRVANPKS